MCGQPAGSTVAIGHDEGSIPIQLATTQPVYQRVGQHGPERDAHARQSAARRTRPSNARPMGAIIGGMAVRLGSERLHRFCR